MGKWIVTVGVCIVLAAGCHRNPGPGGFAAPANNSVDYEGLVQQLTRPGEVARALTGDQLLKRWVIPTSDVEDDVDSRELLRQLFQRVTSGQVTDQAKVEAWARYLQDWMAHPQSAPLHVNGYAVFEPRWLLQHRIGHCGQTNRILADGLAIAGYQTRVVQLRNHVAAEVWLGGQWRYLDADWLNGGQFIRKADGTLASAYEIHRDPSLARTVDATVELRDYPVQVLGPNAIQYQQVFSDEPYYYVKLADPEQEKDVYFGWMTYRHEKCHACR